MEERNRNARIRKRKSRAVMTEFKADFEKVLREDSNETAIQSDSKYIQKKLSQMYK